MTPSLFALVALLLLAACGEVGRPFLGAPQVTANNPLLDIPTAVGIAVVPVRGQPFWASTEIVECRQLLAATRAVLA